MNRVRTFAALAAAVVCSAAFAQEEGPITLKVGDAAPALATGEWVKGEPVKAIEEGKLYVVEFWATWCGPCRTSIPHLSEMSKKNPDVVFIGQDVFEHDESKVKPFVEEMGEKMSYRVAMDDKSKMPDGAMADTWMKAAGRNSIPTAFLVGKDKKIAWIGHPMQLEPVLEQIKAGKYDMKAEVEKSNKEAADNAKAAEIQKKLRAAMQAKDIDGVMKTADEMIALKPDMADQIMTFQFQVLNRAGKTAEARAKADAIVAKTKEPIALNSIAWTMATKPTPSKDELALARRAIDKACELTQSKPQAEVLDTSARVHAIEGQWDKAVEVQKRAVDAADGEMKADLQKSLDAYGKKELPKAE